MTRNDVLALAARVESATGADRELDAHVWLACVPGTTRNELRYIHKATGKECVIDETRDANRCLIVVPAYSASLDAALSLVPSGSWWWVEAQPLGDAFLAGCGDERVATAATPALALTSAALRAIAERMPE